jgi:hypothetical protein
MGYAITLVLLIWLVAALVRWARHGRETWDAINTTWSTWVTVNNARAAAAAIATNARAAATTPPEKQSEKEGGASHE